VSLASKSIAWSLEIRMACERLSVLPLDPSPLEDAARWSAGRPVRYRPCWELPYPASNQ
jgi:hypothetical protein